MNKKGFTLVELMVVVAIVAILAAVALPMYSTFKQKGKVSTAIKSLTGVSGALQNWYEDNGTFLGSIVIPARGGAVRYGSIKIGAGLTEIANLTWSLSSRTASRISIAFDFSAGCPSETCNGTWTMRCCSLNDICYTGYDIGDTNALGLNKTLTEPTGDCN